MKVSGGSCYYRIVIANCSHIAAAYPPTRRCFPAWQIFDPQDGSDSFLRNVVYIRTSQRYIAEDGSIQQAADIFVTAAVTPH
jgi:hypothetical protein